MTHDSDIIAADPKIRRRFIVVACGLLAGALILYVTTGDPIERYVERLVADIETLAQSDPEAAQRRARQLVMGVVIGVWIPAMFVMAYTLYLGRRLWYAAQWPPEDARLIADRRVLRGRALRARAGLLMGVSGVTMVAITYYAAKVVLWARYAS